MYLVLFHLYHREISCCYDVLSLVSIIRAFLYSVGPADESSHYKNEGRKTVWLLDSFLVTLLEYYMHPKLQHISFFSLCSLSDDDFVIIINIKNNSYNNFCSTKQINHDNFGKKF